MSPVALLVRTVRVVRGSENLNGVFAIILTAKGAKIAKVCMVCFSLFVPFASFAVHDSKTECPLYFRRENHREILENCESLYGLFLLVRTVRVVRGSWNSSSVRYRF